MVRPVSLSGPRLEPPGGPRTPVTPDEGPVDLPESPDDIQVTAADVEQFDQTFLAEDDNFRIQGRFAPAPYPLQVLPRVAYTINFAMLYNEDRDRWEPQKKGDFGVLLPTDASQSVASIIVDNRANDAEASGDFAVGLGSAAVASGITSSALGGGTTASGTEATAAGANAEATASAATAIGNAADASGSGATALGDGAVASGLNATAAGTLATASATQSAALGGGEATSNRAVALGEVTNDIADTTLVRGSVGGTKAGMKSLTELDDGEYVIGFDGNGDLVARAKDGNGNTGTTTLVTT